MKDSTGTMIVAMLSFIAMGMPAFQNDKALCVWFGIAGILSMGRAACLGIFFDK